MDEKLIPGSFAAPVACSCVVSHPHCMCVCVCVYVRVCVCVSVPGKNNIKEGGPHGSRAPSGRLRRQLEKDKKLQSWRAVELLVVPARVAVGGLT